MGYLTAEHIEELREQYKLQKMYTEMSDRGQIEWRPSEDGRCCAACGETRKFVTAPGEAPRFEPISLAFIEGEWLCRHCFAGKWISSGCANPGYGTRAPSIPHSQKNYDGGTFGNGEW